jgi:hypothetical protein
MLLLMPRIDRRRFLLASAATAALPSLRAFAQTPTATLTLHPDKPGATVPANFIGLSYETAQLADPTFFSAANTGLIAQFKALTPHGVLRLGGNTSDLGWWKPTADTPQPVIHVRDSHGAEPTAAAAFPVTPQAVTNLRGFLDATGWTCLYGINLGTNTPARAADEAAFVAKALGDKLEYFQLGNEPEGYSTHLRDPKTWSADAFFDEWLAEANAVRARVPGARFGVPDVGWEFGWMTTVAARLLALRESCGEFCGLQGACGCAEKTGDLSTRPRIAALTHHYYIGGPPSNPEMTIAHILQPDPRVLKAAGIVRSAAATFNVEHQTPVPYRMTEGNTCYRGGKPGLSDVFASALWAADYLLTLASLGYAGVNLHGGSAQSVASSLGGHLPGDALLTDANTPHPRPYYSPIGHIDGQYIAEPVSFGMKFASAFAGATMMEIDFHPGPLNVTAYAATQKNSRQILAIINKDTKPFFWDGLSGFVPVDQLSAPSLTSTDVTLSNNGKAEPLMVPASTAVLYSYFIK